MYTINLEPSENPLGDVITIIRPKDDLIKQGQTVKVLSYYQPTKPIYCKLLLKRSENIQTSNLWEKYIKDSKELHILTNLIMENPPHLLQYEILVLSKQAYENSLIKYGENQDFHFREKSYNDPSIKDV